MVVISLEKCPLSLRGDLTRWLQEISPGVYVGQISARVRDNLWNRVCAESKHGRATMVYSARNEQRLDFRVHNSLWEPIDFDGLKLMLHPSAARLQDGSGHANTKGFSTAAKVRTKRRQKHSEMDILSEYVVVDVETTGLDVYNDTIIEIGALWIRDGDVRETFERIVQCNHDVSPDVLELTGLTAAEIVSGEPIETVMNSFLRFVGSRPLVMHNKAFDMGFIDAALEDLDIDSLENKSYDTLALAKREYPGLPSYSLVDLCGFLSIPVVITHRAIPDCQLTNELFRRLMAGGLSGR